MIETVVLSIIFSSWLLTFLVLLFTKKSLNFNKYFVLMFDLFGKSDLRIGWKYLIFGLEYFTGMIIIGFYLSAFYPTKWIKSSIYFILVNKTKQEERKKLEKNRKKFKD